MWMKHTEASCNTERKCVVRKSSLPDQLAGVLLLEVSRPEVRDSSLESAAVGRYCRLPWDGSGLAWWASSCCCSSSRPLSLTVRTLLSTQNFHGVIWAKSKIYSAETYCLMIYQVIFKVIALKLRLKLQWELTAFQLSIRNSRRNLARCLLFS